MLRPPPPLRPTCSYAPDPNSEYVRRGPPRDAPGAKRGTAATAWEAEQAAIAALKSKWVAVWRQVTQPHLGGASGGMAGVVGQRAVAG